MSDAIWDYKLLPKAELIVALFRNAGRYARLLLLPWWVLSLLSGAKAFSSNPILGSRRLNRWGLHAARVRLAARMATLRRRALAHGIDAATRAAFDRDGFCLQRDFLSNRDFDVLRTSILGFSADARETIQGDTITRRIALDASALAANPMIFQLLSDPRWRGLLRYAGSHSAEPLLYIQTIMVGAVEGVADPQTALHADTFHATVKAWFFLTDVAADEGAFCYVAGSHRATPARLDWERRRSVAARTADPLSGRGSLRIRPGELREMGLPAATIMAVRANTLIVADTHGFHARGPSARPAMRIEIWAYARGNPFAPWTGLSWSSLPGVARRQMGWAWRGRDLLRNWIGQPWCDVGSKRAGDPPASVEKRLESEP